MICYEIIIKGRVQGVGFRYFTKEMATLFDIKGYVKNLYNGDVLVMAKGEEKDMKKFINQLETGPSQAFVKSIKKTEIDSCEEYKYFKITY